MAALTWPCPFPMVNDSLQNFWGTSSWPVFTTLASPSTQICRTSLCLFSICTASQRNTFLQHPTHIHLKINTTNVWQVPPTLRAFLAGSQSTCTDSLHNLVAAVYPSGWQSTSLERWPFVGFCPNRRSNAKIGQRSARCHGIFGEGPQHRERPCLGSVLSSEPQDFRDQTVGRGNAWSLDCKLCVKWYQASSILSFIYFYIIYLFSSIYCCLGPFHRHQPSQTTWCGQDSWWKRPAVGGINLLLGGRVQREV